MSRRQDELGRVQAEVERARLLLLLPSAGNLDRSRSHLEQACASLRELQGSIGLTGAPRPELLARLRALRAMGQRVAALVEGAARLQAGWLRALTALTATGAYTPDGQPAPAVAPRSLSIEG